MTAEKIMSDDKGAVEQLRKLADDYEKNPDEFVSVLFSAVTTRGDGRMSCLIRPDLGATIDTVDDIMEMVKQGLYESLDENTGGN
ncbi:MAG TPA: hypothetical protein VEP90_22100 [Methylomirabilota bacterium]|nr:hypothetical protein [Methylomirabilota bacterium]